MNDAQVNAMSDAAFDRLMSRYAEEPLMGLMELVSLGGETYLTPTEVCKTIGKSKATLHRMQRDVGFPRPMKMGDKRNSSALYSQRQIENWFKARTPADAVN